MRQEAQDRERAHRFAGPRFSHESQRAAALDAEGNAVDRAKIPPLVAEGHRKIADFEQARRHLRHPIVLRGSTASRTASPIKTSSDSITAMTIKPDNPSQGA